MHHDICMTGRLALLRGWLHILALLLILLFLFRTYLRLPIRRCSLLVRIRALQSHLHYILLNSSLGFMRCAALVLHHACMHASDFGAAGCRTLSPHDLVFSGFDRWKIDKHWVDNLPSLFPVSTRSQKPCPSILHPAHRDTNIRLWSGPGPTSTFSPTR
jgi:hypothetical protein